MAMSSQAYDPAAAERSIMQLLPSSQHHGQHGAAAMLSFGVGPPPPGPGRQASLTVCQQMMTPPASGRGMQQHAVAQAAPQQDLKTNFYNPYHVKHRRRTTKEQLTLLEGTFESTPKPSSDLRRTLALSLSMTAREVQIWFQNRRAKQKNLNQRATSATKTSADSSPVLSPATVAESSIAPGRAASAEHMSPCAPAAAATSAKEAAQRRHSDIPASLAHCESAGSSLTAASMASASLAAAAATSLPLPPATCGPIDRQLAVASLLPATVLSATMSATAQAELSPPPPPLPYAPPPLSYAPPPGMYLQHVPDASSSRGMAQGAQKKHKHGAGIDAGRYHTARVHQEAFDGTNKLPLKPDDFSPHSADDQFSMLDPSNLPNFMMPGAPHHPPALSAAMASYPVSAAMAAGSSSAAPSLGFSSPATSHPLPHHLTPSMPGAMPLPGTSAFCWNMPYGVQQQPHHHSAGSLPSTTDMSTLLSGLLGLSPTAPYTTMPPLSPFGAPAGPDSSANLAYALDPSTATFYQTLMLLTQQSAAAQHRATAHPPHAPSASEMSPLSPTDSAVLATSPAGAHRPVYLSVDTAAAPNMLMSPPVSSAFSPYESHHKPAQASQHQHAAAMFMPTNQAAAAAAYPRLVASSMAEAGALNASKLFGPVHGSSGAASSSCNSNGHGVL
ncbi:hypothetical protein GGI02_001663 [Coemansia sp. RSA 2322]|nr:hypothetical protein GGI02_001663 [Coemansia sp. RSA 2322]